MGGGPKGTALPVWLSSFTRDDVVHVAPGPWVGAGRSVQKLRHSDSTTVLFAVCILVGASRCLLGKNLIPARLAHLQNYERGSPYMQTSHSHN